MNTHTTIHNRIRRAGRHLAVAALAGIVAIALPGISTASTEVERLHIEDEGVNSFLTQECGTEVEFALDLHITHHSFDDDPLRHRLKERGTLTFTSGNATVVQFWRHAGVHEVVEVLEELEPGVFRARVKAEANGTLQLRTPDGRPLARDAGAITYEDLAVWDRSNDELVVALERTVARVAGPHPLLDDAVFADTVCAELAP